MMRATLVRQASTDLGTPGKLTLENGWSCDTLELPWRQNQKGFSCIKAGAYHGVLFFSDHLQRNVIRFDDKNGRGDVECHNGNFAGDVTKGHVAQTGKTIQNFTQVHGCILPGSGYENIMLPNGSGTQWGIQNSKVTLDHLLAQLNGEDFDLEIEWQSDVWPEDDE